ncbi:MAG: glycosyltransferase [Lachnospiraceae bacterium]|nr:glycosyltransferase [Candidatus Colinaster scatohippi]
MVIHTFIAHMGIGGAERVCVNLTNEWARRGHEVHIVVLNLDNDINTPNLRPEIKVHELGVSRLRYAAVPMLKYIRKNKPGFMFIFGNEMAVILSKLRKLHLVKMPMVVRVLNNVNISLSKEDNVSPVVEKYLQKAQGELAGMEHVIAQCQGMGSQLLDKGIVNKDRMTVVYNPVSEDLLEKTSQIEVSEKADKEIVFIGRIDPQKNPVHLIKAFAKVSEVHPEVKLRMVGSGNLDNQIKELVGELKLTDKVIFDGIRKDMENVYAGAAVVALSSDYEGMPNCLIEAIGCGVPIVSYDCPLGPSEIVVQDVNGYLVPLHDIDGLANKLIEAVERDWDKKAIVDTCDKFRVEKIAGIYEDIFALVSK